MSVGYVSPLGLLAGGTMPPQILTPDPVVLRFNVAGEQDYWHADYWAAGYWSSGYWGSESPTPIDRQGYWHADYWHVNYWAEDYWGRAGGVYPLPVTLPLRVAQPTINRQLLPDPVELPILAPALVSVGGPPPRSLTPSPVLLQFVPRFPLVRQIVAGFRGLFAFWLGGSGAGEETQVATPASIQIAFDAVAATFSPGPGAAPIRPLPLVMQFIPIRPARVTRQLLPDPVVFTLDPVAAVTRYSAHPDPIPLPLVLEDPVVGNNITPVRFTFTLPDALVLKNVYLAHPVPVTTPFVVSDVQLDQTLHPDPVVLSFTEPAGLLVYDQFLTPWPTEILFVVGKNASAGVYIPTLRRRRR